LKIYALLEAITSIIRIVQRENFRKEYSQLFDGKLIDNSSSLMNLNPLIDENRLIRVGGRPKNSNLSLDCKHHILIPKQGHFSERLVEEIHCETGHVGRITLLAIIRRMY
jgi:hypothetical protein